MTQQPPIVIECPECGEKYLIFEGQIPFSDQALRFTDGYVSDQLAWRTPGIIGCVTCELGFFPDKGKLVARPTWDEFCQNWCHLKKAEPPSAGSLAIELRVRKNTTREIELTLRRELWYAANHTENGRLLLAKNARFKEFYLESLQLMQHILDETNEEELLLKAEILRQLGQFDEAQNLLQSNESSWSEAIKTQCRLHNNKPITY
jgi:hypothetical protein